MSDIFDAREQVVQLLKSLPTQDGAQSFDLLERFLIDHLDSADPVPMDQKGVLIHAVSRALSGLYVHMPFKQARYGSNPTERLQALSRNLLLPDLSYHQYMLEIFLDLHDPHTAYYLPEPYRSTTAFLPFLIEACYYGPGDAWSWFVVTHVNKDFKCEGFERGARITHWNGTPIEVVVSQLAHRENGANPHACFARTMFALTVRTLRRLPPPGSPNALIRFLPPGKSEPREMLVDWSVRAAHTDSPQDLRQLLFDLPDPEEQGWTVIDNMSVEYKVMPMAHPTAQAPVNLGIVRIHSFDYDEELFLNQLSIILDTMRREAPLALILDLRGNSGGIVKCGERLLQMLTPAPVTPAFFQFLNTPLLRQLARDQAEQGVDDLQLQGFGLDSDTGATYSRAGQITPIEEANNIGQLYYGRVALVTDALCYSTTDIFAAGFQDHRIGPVIGVSPSTGGGGANVWSYNKTLQDVVSDDGQKFPPLPDEADIGISVRQCMRVGRFHGDILEDFGVQSDYRYFRTEDDLLKDSDPKYVDGVYRFALGKLLYGRGLTECNADVFVHAGQNKGGEAVWNQIRVSFEARGFDYCELFVNGMLVRLYTALREGYRGEYFDQWSAELEAPNCVELKCYKILLRSDFPFYIEEDVNAMGQQGSQAVHHLVASRKVFDGQGNWQQGDSDLRFANQPSDAQGSVSTAEIHYFVGDRGPGCVRAAVRVGQELQKASPEAKVSFVSFGSAARALQDQGLDVIDLKLSAPLGLFDVDAAIRQHLDDARPALIVAHEEFDAIDPAANRGIPCVFLTDWLPLDSRDWSMEQIAKADGLVVLNNSEFLRAAAPLEVRIEYAGPVLRPLRYRWQDPQARQQARQHLGLAPDALLVSVLFEPGTRDEIVAPLRDLVKGAFDALEGTSKHLLWPGDSNLDFDLLIAASDLVVTKNERNLDMELTAIGVPSVSVSHGLNTIDFKVTPLLPNNSTLTYVTQDSSKLAAVMKDLIAKGKAGEINPVAFPDDASARAVKAILDFRQEYNRRSKQVDFAPAPSGIGLYSVPPDDPERVRFAIVAPPESDGGQPDEPERSEQAPPPGG